MLFVINWLGWLLTRVVLSLRYKVTVTGQAEVLRKPGPYLVMPNHIGFTDPPNVWAHLWPLFHFRPVVNEVNFQNPVLGPMGAGMRVIRVPDMDRASADAHQRASQAAAAITAALKAGENVLMWPSGRLTRDGTEKLGGARAVSEILAAVPQATVVLVRTRGLWGSWYSFAYDGTLKPIVAMLLNGLGVLLSNLLLFTPRRRMTMALEAFTATERPEPVRETINPWLDGWYNADLTGERRDVSPPVIGRTGDVSRLGELKEPADSRRAVRQIEGSEVSSTPGERPNFVPYHFALGARTHAFPPPPSDALDLSNVKPEVKQAVADLIAEKIKRPLSPEENRPETTFLALNLDSLDGMDITLSVEQQYGFRGDTVPQSVGQLWALASGGASTGKPKPAPKEWFRPSANANDKIEVLADTVPAAFVARCQKHPKDTAAADDLAGVLNYERMLLVARLMARRFGAFAEPNVGLMLPASVAADLALLGLHLAGKLPVLLNWTTGPANLAHAVKTAELKRVVTSKAFVDRAHVEVPGVEFVFLEDLRKGIGKVEGLLALLGQRFFSRSVRRQALAKATTDPEAAAVVLFTSGSEKAPKAVPLSHRNVLANMTMVIPQIDVTRADIMLGFLPPFHSFGHTVTSLLPILCGVKVLHHPDPTDAGALVRKIAAYKPTVVAGTPTFVGYILDKAAAGDLDSLTMMVVGAEKCPPAIFERSRTLAPNAKVIEGYGITECSPIVSANPTAKPKAGTIGPPLPGLLVRIVDAETNEPLPQGKMGILEVSGPSVFRGYMGGDTPPPFHEADGKQWYITGDLAALDEDGYIVFHGRLKRFLKAGGEMISLPALEEPFAKLYPPTDQGPRVAVEGIETDTGRTVVLFTTEKLDVREANAVLQKEGFRGVMRLDEVRSVDKIPVLGTGKTDYKVLRKMLME